MKNTRLDLKIDRFHSSPSDVSIYVFFDSFFETRGEGKEKYYVISTLRLCKDVSQGQLEKVTSSFYIPGIIREGVADRLGRNTKSGIGNTRIDERKEDLGFFPLLDRKRRRRRGLSRVPLSSPPPRRDQQVWIPRIRLSH